MATRRIQWDKDEYIPDPDPPVSTAPPTIVFEPKTSGHKVKPARELLVSEKVLIESEFCKLNGILTNKECIRIHGLLDPPVTIWEVTGYVSKLHGRIAVGELKVNDLQEYLKWLKQFKTLWDRYQDPVSLQWREYHGKETNPVVKESEPKVMPKFAPFSLKRRVLKPAGG